MEAKQVRDLMEAYSSIYVQSEQEVISEDLQSTVDKGLKAAGENPVIKAIGILMYQGDTWNGITEQVALRLSV